MVPLLDGSWPITLSQGMTKPSALTTSYCSLPSLCLSVEASGVPGSHCMSAGFNCFSHTVSPISRRRLQQLPPSSSLKFLSLLTPWASILTSNPSWVQKTHLPPSCLHVATFQFLDSNSQRGSSSATYYSIIFPEVPLLSFVFPSLFKQLFI